MISRIIAGIIACLIGFNAAMWQYFSPEAFLKATITAFIIGPILGYLSYLGKKRRQKSSK